MRKEVSILLLFFWTSIVVSQEKTLTLSLEEAITYALKNSYNTKAAENDIAAAKQKKWETTTIGLPQISGKVEYQKWLKQQVSLLPAELTGGEPGTFVPVLFGTEQNMSAFVTLNQLLFDGSYLVGLQSAKTYLKISQQAKEKTELLTREAVINAYGNILVTEKSIEILKGNIEILQKNYDDAKKIYENGLNEEEDVEQLEITLSTLKSQLSAAERMQEIAYKMLNIVLGNTLDAEVILTDNLDSLTISSMDFELMTQSFNLNNHIDYKIAANNRESNRLLMRYEQSKALPSISAFVNYGYSAFANEFSFFSGEKWFNSSLLGVSVNIPIFSSLQRSSKTQQAKIALETSDIRLKETEKRLDLEVKQARSNYQLSIENYQTAKKNLNLAERIEKKQRIKFFEGISSSFDLTQAQNQLYSQQQNYIQSMLDVIAKKAELENALNIPIK